jgi:hypothetical protein
MTRSKQEPNSASPPLSRIREGEAPAEPLNRRVFVGFTARREPCPGLMKTTVILLILGLLGFRFFVALWGDLE